MFRSRFTPLVALALLVPAASAEEKNLAETLRALDGNVFKPGSDEAKAAATTLSRSVRTRMQEANRRSTEEWKAIKTKDDWEKFRDAKIKALRDSLGQWPAPPTDLKVQVTGTIDGEGYRIEKIVFQSRPGLFVTANLYTPQKPGKAMPGIIIVHSHHNPKTQGELQDMGVLWARQGCLVLVPDMLGHGERRQHPFKDAAAYPKSFGVSRQDYYFRYNEAMQLHLVGESLMGWMVWDLMRGVDLLLARTGIDKNRIILLGSVAAGGDAAAVTAALDPRITAVVPFNFGGPQPETGPLTADAETRINWAGGGSWESTRNLRRSAADGFLPWVIVGAAAPRGLIYAHEFAWDREHDPIWKRLETIYGFYSAPDKLAETHGYGAVTLKPTEASHANNIGPVHRKGIYPAFKRWFDLPIPEKEPNSRHEAKELWCMTPEVAREMTPLNVSIRFEQLRRFIDSQDPKKTPPSFEQRRDQKRTDWAKQLGVIEPKGDPKVTLHPVQSVGGGALEKLELEVEPGIILPVLLLSQAKTDQKAPIVVGLCQEGKAAFLKNNAAGVAALLDAGVVVCLPDVRGTGEMRAGDGRGRRSSSTSLSASELMLGQTLVGSQLRDLRGVLKFVRALKGVDGKRIALWGTSFAKTNPHGKDLGMPLELEPLPDGSEPLGGLLALFGALYEPEIKAVYVQNGLVGYQSVLESPFVYMPHDAVVPGALTAGDLCDVAAVLAPRLVRIETPVDGLNRRVTAETLKKTYGDAKHLTLIAEPRDDGAKWLIEALKTK